MKNYYLLFVIIGFLPIIVFGQNDTILSNTKIQKILNSTSNIYKIEVVDIADVSGIKFRAVIADNLDSKVRTKAVMIGNDWSVNIWTGKTKASKITYLDYDEIDVLKSFFENCDKTWKNQKVENSTYYTFSSNDGLIVKFHCDKGSKSWDFYLTFTGYILNNFEHLSKRKSDDLFLAVTKVKQYLDSIKDE